MTAVTHFALARPYRLSLDSYAAAAPASIPSWYAAWSPSGCWTSPATRRGALWFHPSQVGEMARIQRLRMSLNLGYSAIGLVVELLDRIAELERRTTAHVTTRRRSMDMNRLTQKSQEALHDAQTKALRFGHVEVDGEHLLLALLDQGEGLVAPLLARAGADPDRLRERPGGRARPPPRVTGPGPPGPGAHHPAALAAARHGRPRGPRLKDEYVSVEHLVIALVEEGSGTAAGRLLHAQG